MKHYALLGEHLGHSLSVPIHQAVFRALGLDADYRLIELPRADFNREAARLLTELDGFNITIPYKREILPLLEGISPEAQAVGAVNTVLCGPGAPSFGTNTDVAGFAASLAEAHIDPAGQPCWVLGTGGASRAVCAALLQGGAAQVTLVSRQPGADTVIGGTAIPQVDYEAFTQAFSGLLVNTTPAGMHGFPSGCPLTAEQLRTVLPKASAVADVIYNPLETPLLAAAADYGLPRCNGLYMLVAQGLAAEALWQGREMPQNLLPEIAHELEALLT